MSSQMTLADGQVAAAAAAIYTASGFDASRVNITLLNTSASTTETVTVTFQRNGGTARRIVRAVLVPNEQLHIRGLAVQSGDIVLAVTSNASTVDYVVSMGGTDFTIVSYDANGALKQVNGTSLSGAVTASSVAVTAGLTSSGATGAGVGYATGAGGAVSQATDRTTGVTLNKLAGQITTQATSLAAAALVSFTVTNSTVALGDVVVVSIQSGPTTVGTIAYVTTVAAGSFQITLKNGHASTADTGAAILNFAVIKSVAA